MIYYNNQLMPDMQSARLFMVSNSKEFTRFEDHQAGVCMYLHELVENAKQSQENPITLIENYLGVVYTEGNSVAEIADFLYEHDVMQLALWSLKERWDVLDMSLPEDSLLHGGGLTRREQLETYTQTTLRSYLETLASYDNE